MATGEVGSRWPSYPARLIVEPSGETQLRWTDFVTEFGEDYLGPELITHLENLYYKTPDPQDRKQCVRLLAALTLGKEVREKEKEKQAARSKLVVKRPNTAMPSLGGPRRKPPVSTHYTQEYPGIDVSRNTRPAEQRPSTTKNSYQAYHELNGRLGTPHYDEQFTWKPPSKREPIRAGSSSGNRRNNPHPHESFMVWKFPKGVPEDQKLYPSDLTDSMMDEICMDKCKSTYQDDYLGLPQGYSIRSAYDGYKENWRDRIPYTMNTTTRYTYQLPQQQKELQQNVSRYGCNTKKSLTASGIVPHAPSKSHLVTVRTRTTYDRQFGKPLPTARMQIEKALETGQIDSYLKSANDREKDVISRMLQSIALNDEKYKMPTPPSHPCSTSKERTQSPNWVSCWTGPM